MTGSPRLFGSVRHAAAYRSNRFDFGNYRRGLGITVASGATPIFSADDPPAPDLTLACPPALELGDTLSLEGTLVDETGKPIDRQEVTVTRNDEFSGATVVGTVTTTANNGSFDGLSDKPANRGNQDYEVTFAGDADHAAASAGCTTDVHGTNSTLDAVEPTSIAVGDDVQVTGTLETASGDPVSTPRSGPPTPSATPTPRWNRRPPTRT